jgi:hypothetical protein
MVEMLHYVAALYWKYLFCRLNAAFPKWRQYFVKSGILVLNHWTNLRAVDADFGASLSAF